MGDYESHGGYGGGAVLWFVIFFIFIIIIFALCWSCGDYGKDKCRRDDSSDDCKSEGFCGLGSGALLMGAFLFFFFFIIIIGLMWWSYGSGSSHGHNEC